MSQARCNRRRAVQLRNDNRHLSGLGVSRYAHLKGAGARAAAKKARRVRKGIAMGLRSEFF